MIIQTRGEKIFHVINYFLLGLLALAMILPFINVLAVSLSSERAVLSGEVSLWPVEFTTDTYYRVFKGTMIMGSLWNTVVLTVVGTVINMVMTVAAAYALSKKRLAGRKIFLMLITFTMLVNPGIIPNFILVKSLGLTNSYWSVWLMGAISTYNMIVLKSFFQSLPDSLEEAASIDGCNDLQTLLRVVLPLSLPSIATITLFYAVGHWNSYQNVLIYINSSSLATLQIRLRDMILHTSLTAAQNMIIDSADYAAVAQESMQGAAIVIATVPILAVYPFLQKYFVKGVMIGSIKE